MRGTLMMSYMGSSGKDIFDKYQLGRMSWLVLKVMLFLVSYLIVAQSMAGEICYGKTVSITGINFGENEHSSCSTSEHIVVGDSVSIEDGASLALYSRTITLRPPFSVVQGGTFSIGSPWSSNHDGIKGVTQLGGVAGGSVGLFELDGTKLGEAVSGNGQSQSVVGDFFIENVNVNPDSYYLLQISGGEIVDIGFDGFINELPMPMVGTISAIYTGRQLNDGIGSISFLSDLLVQMLGASINSYSSTELSNKIDELLPALIHDLNGDGVISLEDVAIFNESLSEHRLNLRFSFEQAQKGYILAFYEQDEMLRPNTDAALINLVPPEIIIENDMGYFIIGNRLEWKLFPLSSSNTVEWLLNGEVLPSQNWMPTSVGQHRLIANIYGKNGALIGYKAKTLLTDEVSTLGVIEAGASDIQFMLTDSSSGLDGVTVKVPAAALNENQQIKLVGSKLNVLSDKGFEALTPILEMQPSGLNFNEPIKLVIPFDVESVTAGSNLRIARLSSGKTDYLAPSYVDHDRNEVIFETEHFSRFQLIKIWGITTESEQEMQDIRDFMNGYIGSIYKWAGSSEGWKETDISWEGFITDEQIAEIINRDISKYGNNSLTPYDVYTDYRRMEKAHEVLESYGPGIATIIQEVFPTVSEFSSAMETFSGISKFLGEADGVMSSQVMSRVSDKMFGGYKEYLSVGVNVGTVFAGLLHNICVSKSAESLRRLIRDGHTLDTALKKLVEPGNEILLYEHNYAPLGESCDGLENRKLTKETVIDNYWKPIYTFWQMAIAFEAGSNGDLKDAVRDVILSAAQNPEVLHANIKIKYNDIVEETDKLNGKLVRIDDYYRLAVPSDVTQINIEAELRLALGSNVAIKNEKIRIISRNGEELASGCCKLSLDLKTFWNVFTVESDAEYNVEDSIQKTKRSIREFRIFRKPTVKTYQATKTTVAIPTLTRSQQVRSNIKADFVQVDNTNRSEENLSPTRSIDTDIPLASYAMDIICGSYRYHVGKDGALIVPVEQAESPELSNCEIHIKALNDADNVDEILDSSLSLDLKSELQPATTKDIPNDRAIMGIYKINGVRVERPRQEQDIKVGDSVEIAYYLPPASIVQAYNLDGDETFYKTAEVTPAPLGSVQGLYSYTMDYVSTGLYRPAIKVSVNDVDAQASAPPISVIPDIVNPIEVTLAETEIRSTLDELVLLAATITGDYSSISWKKIQGPTDLAMVKGSNTKTLQFILPVAGVYIVSIEVCYGHYCVEQQATITAGQLPPIPGGFTLNDTGITTCSNADTNGLTCPVTGYPNQDAQYGRDVTHNDDSDGHAGFSFTRQGTECVKDNVTGLTWEVKTDDGDLFDMDDLHDRDGRYNWYNTDSSTNGGHPGYADNDGNICYGYNSGDPSSYCNTQAYVARVNQAGWCGHSDWRMPTREELRSLVDYSVSFPGPTIDTDYFHPNDLLTNVWSSSPDASNSGSAWLLHFSDGNDSTYDKGSSGYVRLVRGGQ